MNRYRPPLTMRYGMPQPTATQRAERDAREQAWLDSLASLRKQQIHDSVIGLGRRPIDAAAFNGNWKRPTVKP